MSVNKIDAYGTPPLLRPQERDQRVTPEEKAGKDPLAVPDSVQLSKEYQEMTQVKRVAMNRSELRSEQVDHFRNLVENRQYEVEPEKVADKMLEGLW